MKKVIVVVIVILVIFTFLLMIADNLLDDGRRSYDSFEEMHKVINKDISKNNSTMIFPDALEGLEFKSGNAWFLKKESCRYYDIDMKLEDGNVYGSYILSGVYACERMNVKAIYGFDELEPNMEYKGIPIQYEEIAPKYDDIDDFDGKFGFIIYKIHFMNCEYKTYFHFRFPSSEEDKWPDFEVMYSDISPILFNLVKQIIDSGLL
jgi:hypothetical protein